MPPQLSAYHLSNQLKPSAHEPGLFLAASPAFIFGHYQQGDCYLHRVAYLPDNIKRHYEDGHHDGASSFNFDEYLLLDDLTIEASWSLSCEQDLAALIDGEFYQAMNSSLMTGHSHFIKALLHCNDDSGVAWLIDKLALSYRDACEQLPNDKLHLAELCGLPFFALHDHEIAKQEDNFFSDDWSQSLVHNHKGSSQPDQKQPATTEAHSFRLDWLEIAQGRDYSWDGSGIDLGNIGRAGNDALFAIFSATKPAPDLNTRTQMACHALLQQQAWQDYLQPGDTLAVPGAFMVVLMRRGHTRLIAELLSYPYFSFSRELEFFTSRLTVYSHFDLLDALAVQQKNSTTFTAMRASYQQACFTTRPEQPQPIHRHTVELLHWQLSHKLSLAEYAAAGFKLALDQLLQQGPHTQAVLNSAIEKAAEFGYTEIVTSLHQQDANLTAGGYWPIKYANKFGYSHLKQYLLNQGQEDRIFS